MSAAWVIVESNSLFDPVHVGDSGGRRISSYSGFSGGDIYTDYVEAAWDAKDMARHSQGSTFEVVRLGGSPPQEGTAK